MQDRRRLGTSGSHNDNRLRGPGQPGRGWLRSPAGADSGEPSCPRPKPGCGWKHPRGCGRKQSVYPLGPTARLGRGARATLGVAVQPRFSSAGRASAASQSQERGRTENATPPSPKNDLGREVTCAPEPRCGYSQRGRGGEKQGRLLPGRGRGSRISAPRGSGRDDWSLGDLGFALRCRPPVTTAGLRPGGASAAPGPAGFSAAGPRASGCPAPGAGDPRPPARAEAPPALARPLPGPRPGCPRERRSRARGPGAGPGGRAPGWPRTSATPQRRPPRPRPAPRVPRVGKGAEAEIRETPEPGGFPKYRRAVVRPVSLRLQQQALVELSTANCYRRTAPKFANLLLKAHPCP
ncbi:unnamed protein product [Rangifer tarandus platyrhynchus]|uniref:Collagen alpha-1(I) chain-like n=1 Tax=Rangifer tarandus platyrhynchus TaxID=3082113 RepID=A0ABN8ZVK6_RANTA|nr:unnamed protein product [Rangifer tarandus platyrhynchus]